MLKLQLLLKLKDKNDQLPITRELSKQFAWIQEHNEGSVRVASRNARAREMAPVMDVPELDVILELGLPDSGSLDGLVERAASLVPTFKDLVDPTASVAIVGQEHILVTGEGPFQLFRCFGRKKGISLLQFKDHFLNIHSQFGIGLPGRPAYKQLHRDETATAALREVTGFNNEEIDGVAQLLFYGPGAFEELGQQSPERLKGSSEDGALFIDADTRRTSIASVLLNAGPID